MSHPPSLSLPPASETVSATRKSMLSYDGEIGAIYKIWIVNFLLCLVTLWIYRPWAKTRMRRYIYSRFMLDGVRLQYTGKGGELFFGGLKVFGSIFLLFALLGAGEGLLRIMMQSESKEVPTIVVVVSSFIAFLSYAVYFMLFYFGQYASRRYRLSRTKWQGVRGAMVGSAVKYALSGMWHLFLNIITLGFIMPRYDMVLRMKLVRDIRLGQQHCRFKASDWEKLYTVHIVTWLLAIPTLTMSRFWYRARLNNQYFKSMNAGTLHFDSVQKGGGLMWLFMGNLLLFFSVVGIPFVVHRHAKYYARHTILYGSLEGALLEQVADHGGGAGDVIGESYEGTIDFDMGII